jgi:putative spermidine/putrescine transport system permease protein
MPKRLLGLLLVTPALAVIAALFILPLVMSAVGAFKVDGGSFGLGNFYKTFDLYLNDIVFTVVIVSVSTALVGLGAIAIGGYLTLGEHPLAVSILRWLYRWPMFIPVYRRRPDPADLSLQERDDEQHIRSALA